MKRTKTTIFIILVLAFTAVPLTLFSFATADATFVLPDYEPMEIGPEFREKEFSLNLEYPMSASLRASDIDDVDVKTWLTLDAYEGYYFFDDYILKAEGLTAEIWVQVDLSWPEGDPRDYPLILQEQLDYLLDEFENNIYPVDTEYFGTPDLLNGSNSLLEAWGYFPPGYYFSEEGKNIIMVSNVRDDSYYDSTYPAYIAGFYSPTYEAYFDRNIINIDCHDWMHRIGPEGYEWVPGEPVTRPELYESIIAHEYQHLIHDDYVELSETWMNEACSLFAEPLCGYEIDPGQMEWFLATPDNSLTKWGDQGDINILADYGSSMLWALYLTSHYGFDFMGRYVSTGGGGIEEISALLSDYGVDFYDVYHDWRLANFICAEDGPYSYGVFDFDLGELDPIKVHDVEGKTIPWTSAVEEFGETYTIGTESTPDGYPTTMFEVGPFGTEYIQFSDLRGLYKFKFDGDDIAPYGWTFDEYWGEWWSGAAHLLDALLITNPYTVQEGDILSVPSDYSIEEYWDFGFIQFSTDNGETWTSMANEYTTMDHDDDAHPNITPNLPGITGTPGGYVDLQFDLDDFITPGTEVIFGFRYMTDWATLNYGWYIVGAFVGETELELTPVYPEADFMVSIVSKYKVFGHTFYHVREMNLADLTEFGCTLILDTKWKEVTIVVSPINIEGFVDYSFKVSRLRCRWIC